MTSPSANPDHLPMALGDGDMAHRPPAPGRRGLPRPLPGRDPPPRRVRPARLPHLVPTRGLEPLARPAPPHRALRPLDAGDPPLRRLDRVAADVRRGRLLPHLRHRRAPGALPRRLRPPPERPARVTHPRPDPPAARSPARPRGTPANPCDFALVCLLGLLGPAHLRGLRAGHRRHRRGARPPRPARGRQGPQGRPRPAASRGRPRRGPRHRRPHRPGRCC